MRPNSPETFWSNVDRGAGAEECWRWRRGLGRGGYGKAKYRGVTWRAHRLAWTLANGPIPDGLQVNHSCDNRVCCNPAHLSLGTQADNIAQAVSRGRMATGDRQGFRVHPESRLFGERNPSAKLSAEQVRDITASKERTGTLVARYGVTKETIASIRKKRSWPHLAQEGIGA